jgi:hypothetical protein
MSSARPSSPPEPDESGHPMLASVLVVTAAVLLILILAAISTFA